MRAAVVGLALVFVALGADSGACQERAGTGSGGSGPPAMERLLEALDLGGYAPDDAAPPFDAVTLDGRAVSLPRLRGRVVFVTFWASWCRPCKEELPLFERLYRQHKSRGLTVLGINVREGVDTIRPFTKPLGLTFPLPLDADGDISRQYGVVGLPTTFLIDRDGRPVGRAVGPRVWDGAAARAIVGALLAQPAIR